MLLPARRADEGYAGRVPSRGTTPLRLESSAATARRTPSTATVGFLSRRGSNRLGGACLRASMTPVLFFPLTPSARDIRQAPDNVTPPDVCLILMEKRANSSRDGCPDFGHPRWRHLACPPCVGREKPAPRHAARALMASKSVVRPKGLEPLLRPVPVSAVSAVLTHLTKLLSRASFRLRRVSGVIPELLLFLRSW